MKKITLTFALFMSLVIPGFSKENTLSLNQVVSETCTKTVTSTKQTKEYTYVLTVTYDCNTGKRLSAQEKWIWK